VDVSIESTYAPTYDPKGFPCELSIYIILDKDILSSSYAHR